MTRPKDAMEFTPGSERMKADGQSEVSGHESRQSVPIPTPQPGAKANPDKQRTKRPKGSPPAPPAKSSIVDTISLSWEPPL